MWYVVKDEDHPDSPKMVKKGWVIGIVLTLISFAWIPLMLIPFAFMGVDQQQMGDHMQVIPEPDVRMVPEAPQQQVPAPGFEDVPEMIVCDSSYPDVCIPRYPPDLDCGEIGYSNFRVVGNDPHGLDADNDGIGCESGSTQSSTPAQPTQQKVPAPGFEDVPEMIVCDSSYPDVCIPSYPQDLDCGEIQYANFKVLQPDPHGFDRDKDGIGCES